LLVTFCEENTPPVRLSKYEVVKSGPHHIFLCRSI
jgi:hypothetical protein